MNERHDTGKILKQRIALKFQFSGYLFSGMMELFFRMPVIVGIKTKSSKSTTDKTWIQKNTRRKKSNSEKKRVWKYQVLNDPEQIV